LLASLAFVACKVDEAAFQARVFSCDTASAHPLCGTDQSGNPMTCFAARQLGGTDFCTEACAQPMSLPDENAQCVSGGAKLKSCSPSVGDDSCGRPELGCLRTDVTTDEGVCVTMKPCSVDSDCRDPVRSTCASTFFSQLYSKSTDPTKVVTDHLYCLQEGCEAGNSACSPGEVCLKKVIPAAGHPPDICVPKCDSNNQCPPNFICLRNDKISGPDNPAVCVPGLLGFKCLSDIDCLVGKCLSDGGDQVIPGSAGLHLCTVDCTSDNDCNFFDSDQGLFYCSADHHCVTPTAYTGATCKTKSDCTRDPSTDCFYLSASSPDGTCLHPCGDDLSCPALGGVPHTCYPPAQLKTAKVPGGCLPGMFGLPCGADASCVPGLTCRNVSATTKLCTTLCQTDADCAANRFAGGFCGGQVCLPNNSLPDGSPCARDNQCHSNKCAPPADMSSPIPTCQKTTST
jgi:hypothetical protein